MSEIKDNIKRGLFWTAVDKYSGQIIAIGISMVLARLLTPGDYGIVATATVFLSFLGIFTSIGIGPAVIQRKDLTQEDLNNIFTFTVIIGGICALIAFGSSWLIADFYGNEVLRPVMQIFSIGVFIGAINMVPSALMSKNLRFKEMATRNLLFQIFFGVIGIAAAFMGAGVYALILPSIASSLCSFLYNNHFYPVRINLRFSFVSIKKIFSFSSYLFLFELFTYFSRNLDKVIIGKDISENALGYYEKSYRLMQLPLQNVTAVIYPVLQPVLSSLQDNMKEMSSKCNKIISMIACIGFPLCAILYFCGEEIVIVMFGDQWGPSIPTFKILSLSVPFMMILYPTGPFFFASNLSKTLFYTGIINTTVTICGYIIAIYIDKTTEAIAWSVSITVILNSINSYFNLYNRVMKASLVPLLKGFIRPMTCTILVFCTYIGYEYMSLHLPLFASLVVKGLIGLLVALIYYNFVGIVNIKELYCLLIRKLKCH